MGGYLREDTLDVLGWRVGNPALAVDQVVPHVEVDIVGTEAASAGEANEGRAGGRPVRAPAAIRARVAHVGDDLREYAVDVLGRRVGDPALAADQVVPGVQVDMVAAEAASAGEAKEQGFSFVGLPDAQGQLTFG